MKKILFIIFLFVGLCASAQVDTTKPIQKINGNGFAWKTTTADSAAMLPQDTFRLKSTWRGIAFKGTVPYYWTGTKWEVFGTGGGLSRLGPAGVWLVKTTDSTYAVDTAAVNAYYRALFPDYGTVWKINGNGGIDPLINYLGTQDSVPLIFKVRDTTLAGFVGVKGLYYPEVGYMEYLDDVSFGAAALKRKLSDFPGVSRGVVAIGSGALRNFKGDAGGADVAIGRGAMRDDSTSYRSVHIGEYNGYMGPGGQHNTSTGAFGLETNRGGSYNSGFGSNTLRSNKLGSFNNAFSFFALLQNTTVVDTIIVSEGGTGYTSAPTVTISAPDPATAGSLSIQATATAVLNGDSVQYVLMTSKGAGYSGAGPAGPVTVGFSGGGGSGAVASVTLVSGEYNNGFGYAAGAFNRAGQNGIYIGMESGMGLANASPSYFDDDVIFIGHGASRSVSVPWNTKLKAAVAFGYNSKVAKDSTIALGGVGFKVVIGGDTVYTRLNSNVKLDVQGNIKTAGLVNDEGSYMNYITMSSAYKGFPNITFGTGSGSTGNDASFFMGSSAGSAIFGTTNNTAARTLVFQNVYGYKPIVFQVQGGDRARFADTTGNFILYNDGTFTDNGRLLQVRGKAWVRDSLIVDSGVYFGGTGAARMHVGSTAQRPTVAAGLIRYNSDSSWFEFSNGTTWNKFGTGTSDGNNYPTGITYTDASRTLAIQRSSLADISTVLPLATSSAAGLMDSTDKKRLDSNSYIYNEIVTGYDTLTRVDVDTLKIKAVKFVSDDGIQIDKEVTNSTLKFTIGRKQIGEPIATFNAGAGVAGDTTIFTDSTLYGSFYTDQDSFYIVRAVAVLKGQAGDTLGIKIVWNDSINVDGTLLNAATLAVNSRTTGNSITISSNGAIPPNSWVWVKSPTVIVGKKPEYLSVTLIGYRKYVIP